MSENLLYEYAVIRIVPRVERAEFINAGIILYCHSANFLGMKYTIDVERIRGLYPESDIQKITKLMSAFEKVAYGKSDSGEIGKLTPAERFRWLSAKRSTIIQVSEVHPGFCKNPKEETERLFNNMVIL